MQAMEGILSEAICASVPLIPVAATPSLPAISDEQPATSTR